MTKEYLVDRLLRLSRWIGDAGNQVDRLLEDLQKKKVKKAETYEALCGLADDTEEIWRSVTDIRDLKGEEVYCGKKG